MRLVKLTRPNAECVWVNPAQIIAVEPVPMYATADDEVDTPTATGSRIFFALAGRSWNDESCAEAEPYRLTVTECPSTVAGLFLEPLR